jgi:NTP pyrophosphatase (non-canonical NTP hydrolase)
MSLTFDEYQHIAVSTAAKHDDWNFRVAILALGAAGEAGEVADLVKKQVGHGHPVDQDKVAKEIGDVLWYLANLAEEYGLRLGDIAHLNNEKLRQRYPNGFSTADSMRRVDLDLLYASEQDPERGFETVYPPIAEGY